MSLFKKTIRKVATVVCISGTVMLANLPLFNGFEAHTVNVTATVCDYSEIRSKGFWKTHIEDAEFQPFKNQTIGNETVGSATAAIVVLKQGDSSDMRNKLRAQLLTMKFNNDYLGTGDFLDEKENKTLSEIVAEADTLLKDPNATKDAMEEMKDLLEYWNTQETIALCSIGIDLPPNPTTTNDLLINKVYFAPDSDHKTLNDPNEWVEIYNPTTLDVNLKSWEICDGTSCDILSNEDLVLPAGKYAVITDSKSTWKFWDVPEDAPKIVFSNPIGSGLNDDGDMLILKNTEKEIVDQMNWGKLNAAWVNKNDKLWDPGIKAKKGDILARNPDGFDTDQVSDWKVYQLPKVEVIYPNGGEIFTVGHSYEIKWKANNTEDGEDDDLVIDIWYSNDSGNTWANMVRDTENDGFYENILPLCLENEDGSCYWVPSEKARVKVVATDTERNFMFSNWDTSNNDFCPPIDFSLLTPAEAAMLAAMGITEESSLEFIYAQNEVAATLEIEDFERIEETAIPETEETPQEEQAEEEIIEEIDDTKEVIGQEVDKEEAALENEETILKEEDSDLEENEILGNKEEIETEEKDKPQEEAEEKSREEDSRIENSEKKENDEGISEQSENETEENKEDTETKLDSAV